MRSLLHDFDSRQTKLIKLSKKLYSNCKIELIDNCPSTYTYTLSNSYKEIFCKHCLLELCMYSWTRQFYKKKKKNSVRIIKGVKVSCIARGKMKETKKIR